MKVNAGGRTGAAAAQAGGVQATQTAPVPLPLTLAPAALSPRLQEVRRSRSAHAPATRRAALPAAGRGA